MTIEKINKINNPLTIIAIFAALAEVNSSVAISFINPELHYIFIWFIIGFPVMLVLLFFGVLIFKSNVMYAPSDFRDDDSYFKSMHKNNYGVLEDGKVENLEEKIINELEIKINEKINQQIDKVSQKGVIDKKVDTKSLKDEMKFITNESVKEIKNEFFLTDELKSKMLNYINYPAFYILIYSIVRSKATNIKKLEEYSMRYFIPEDWSLGLQMLIENEIVIGNNNSFKINDKFREQLENWVLGNRNILILMRQQFRRKRESPKNLADRFDERIYVMARGLKF
ncbi:MAG: hypothetical protein WC358_03080 [Ignavibacteria bacterium]|jgi:hypothetical protein